jgi:DNA polymerase elongation subunit (family B)
LDERLKTQWSRKSSYLKKESEQSDEELFHERAGIYAEFGKIVCIAVGKIYEKENGQLGLKTKVYANHDEKILLEEFKAMLEKMDPTTLKLCAHNGKEFDFPYISRRMLVKGIALPDALNLMGKKPWEVAHLDTMEMWKFGDYKHFTSLDLLAAIFDIPSSKAGIDGSQVNAVYYKEKNLEKIKLYCARDVVVLVQLYLRLRSMPLLEPSNIINA